MLGTQIFIIFFLLLVLSADLELECMIEATYFSHVSTSAIVNKIAKIFVSLDLLITYKYKKTIPDTQTQSYN